MLRTPLRETPRRHVDPSLPRADQLALLPWVATTTESPLLQTCSRPFVLSVRPWYLSRTHFRLSCMTTSCVLLNKQHEPSNVAFLVVLNI